MSDATKAAKVDEENNKVATIPRPKPQLLAGNAGHAIVPQSVEACFRMADLIIRAQMAPKSFKTPEAVCVAIMHGLELGLTPMAALQSIAVVNGMPTVWGDGLLALVQNSGLLEEMDEEIHYDNQEPIGATCTMTRVGRKPVSRMFTKPMAARAGLLKKEGPWTQYPHRMYQMRARAWCARDVFPDVLRGLGSAEERQDMVDVTDQGSASTPEPKRADFKADDTPVNVEVETWELFDEVGEMVGEFEARDWVDKLTTMFWKTAVEHRKQILENNFDTAEIVAEKVGEQAAAGLHGLFEPGQSANTAVNWHVEGVVGEGPIIKAIKDLIDTAPRQADVQAIIEQNSDRLGKMSAMKRDGITQHAEARLEALKA